MMGTHHALVAEEVNKATLRRFLPNHFWFRENVVGKDPWGNKVIPDFWCLPKEHLLANGWENRPFVIEAKGGGDGDWQRKAAIALVYQSVIYQMSTFPTKEGDMRPRFVLVYPSIGVLLGEGAPQQDERSADFRDGIEHGLVRVMQKFAVGDLKIWRNESSFEVFFGGQHYYSTRYGLSPANPLGKEHHNASR